MKTNLELVQDLYAAFGQGNIPFILENVGENFTWTDPSNPAIVPHGGRHAGKAEFLNFFQQLGGHTDTTLFEVENYAAADNLVMAAGKHGVTAKATGKSLLFDWTMLWNFEGGVPVSGRSFYDTAAGEKIYQ